MFVLRRTTTTTMHFVVFLLCVCVQMLEAKLEESFKRSYSDTKDKKQPTELFNLVKKRKEFFRSVE